MPAIRSRGDLGAIVQYIDTGIREAGQTVAWWMQQVSADAPCQFRCQSGYFTLEGSGALLATLEGWADRGLLVRLLLGSNRASTLASHVSYLAGRLGLPRPHIGLGIFSFEGSLFHPKVYHFLREDGSETAYVGSANFTGPGISGLNVEAGIIVDTREGDDPLILRSIRDRIDAWFEDGEAGLSQISSPEDIQRLLDQGYLSLRVVRPPAEAGLDDEDEQAEPFEVAPARPRRGALVRLPRLDAEGGAARPGEQTGNEGSRNLGKDAQRRFIRHTEASFHYPQGTHLGHILAILWRFESGRDDTPFDDRYIRLSGSLGSGRIAGFRRQIKYKLLAAMELGLVTDIRYVDDSEAFVPELTDVGRMLWRLVSPHVDTAQLEMGGGVEQSTTLPQPPTYYNQILCGARNASLPLKALYSRTMLSMPAVQQLIDFLSQFPDDRIAKDEVYRGFFESPNVIAFCDEVGIDPQTEESARHRCPFLLNILESLARIDQERTHIIRR